MPGLNGIEITKKICDEFPRIKILMQTVFNDSEKIFLPYAPVLQDIFLKMIHLINLLKQSTKFIMEAHHEFCGS